MASAYGQRTDYALRLHRSRSQRGLIGILSARLFAFPWRGMFAGIEEVHIVAQYFGMIESQRRRRRTGVEERAILRVIGCYRRPFRAPDVHRGDCLPARIAIGPRINSQ